MERKYKITLFATILCLLLALAANIAYNRSPLHSIDLKKTANTVNRIETKATKLLIVLQDIVSQGGIDSLYNKKIDLDNDLSYFVYSNGILEYWSSNTIPLNNLNFDVNKNIQYLKTANAHCLAFVRKTENDVFLVIQPIKYYYPYENDKLKNNFHPAFKLDSSIEVVQNEASTKYAITDSEGNYLFSIESNSPVYNNTYGWFSFVLWGIALILLLYIYANFPALFKSLNSGIKILIIAITSTIVGMSLYFNYPEMIYWKEIFSAFQYASNPFLGSISHLSIISLFLLANSYLFFRHLKPHTKKHLYYYIGLLVFSILFFAFYNILSGLVFHSSIDLNIFRLQDLSFVSIWVHFLIFIWGLSLTLILNISSNYIDNNNKHKAYFAIGILVIIAAIIDLIFNFDFRFLIAFTLLIVVLHLGLILKNTINTSIFVYIIAMLFAIIVTESTIAMSKEKKNEKYKIIAQNILVNGNTENDRMADILLEELNEQITFELSRLTQSLHPDSARVLNNYFNNRYLRGFWSKYEMRLLIADKYSESIKNYTDFVDISARRIKDTQFFNVPSNYDNMAYIGIFETIGKNGSKLSVVFEFFQRQNFKSYSFPNLFSSETPDLQNKLNINVSIYENGLLSYQSGQTKPDKNFDIRDIAKNKKEFFTYHKNAEEYYIYQSKNNILIIKENNQIDNIQKFAYMAYVILFYMGLAGLVLWYYNRRILKIKQKNGFTLKFQYLFISLLIISFVSIFFVSINYFKLKNEKQQLDAIQQKKRYIQKALQDMYYWSQDLSSIDRQALNLDLQELSYIYETDIHVYDNFGVLVGSSQPLIFSKNLLSNLIAPLPYFGESSDVFQYEKIAELQYLNAYVDFVNGDFMQLGFIAVPQFLSEEMNRSEIESFIAVIAHIYLIITLLVIVLSLIIGQQLSAPLNLISQKLKQMNYGKRNEKIEYKYRDEIGELVEQYNRTIEALEDSANKLAQTERETAWKTMARQIAHEINNPLTPMKLTIQQLQRTKHLNDERFDDYFEKSTKTLIEQINNLSRIAGTFSNFARMPEAQLTEFDIAEKLSLTVALFASNNENISIHYSGPNANVIIVADVEQMIQVFNNLLKNALQAIPENKKGIINVGLEIIENNTNKNKIKISISDNGVGMSGEVEEKLFSPNFSTKSTGMGLGLSISKNIVETLGGKITYTTQQGEGTTFSIEL